MTLSCLCAVYIDCAVPCSIVRWVRRIRKGGDEDCRKLSYYILIFIGHCHEYPSFDIALATEVNRRELPQAGLNCTIFTDGSAFNAADGIRPNGDRSYGRWNIWQRLNFKPLSLYKWQTLYYYELNLHRTTIQTATPNAAKLQYNYLKTDLSVVGPSVECVRMANARSFGCHTKNTIVCLSKVLLGSLPVFAAFSRDIQNSRPAHYFPE